MLGRVIDVARPSLEVRFSSLLAVLESIGGHSSLADLLDEVARRLGPLVGCDTVLLMVHDAGQDVVRLKLLGGRPAGLTPERECPAGDSVAGEVVRAQAPVFVADTRLDRRGHACARLLAENGLLASWTYPLTTSRRRIGAIAFCSVQAGSPGPEERVVLGRISNLVALAVENSMNQESSRAFEQQLEAERDRLKLLLDVNAAVVAHLELEPLVAAITACLKRVMTLDGSSLLLHDGEADALAPATPCQAMVPGGKSLKLGTSGATDPSPAGRAFRSRKPFATHTAAELEAFPGEATQALLAKGVRSTVSAPLLAHDKALGVLVVTSSRERAFSAADVALLAQVASQIAPAVENARAYCQIRALKEKLDRQRGYLEAELQHEFDEIVGQSGPLQKVLEQVRTVAPTPSTVLVWGETGTGKELIARAVHALSGRKGTFVKLNCAAIPTGLLESELFGHEKGAFTGALAQRIGRFELADGGTLFLDEVGDIPPELQPKLLRVLQERELERLGSASTIKVDVRLVAATNRDLAQMVAERTFRSDLYYRLAVFPVSLPPLRERPGDVQLLAEHFMQRFAARMKKRIDAIPPDAVAALAGHDWPGNIRELENFIERAVILTRGGTLEVPLGELRPRGPGATSKPAAPSGPAPTTLADAEREHILRALTETKWVVGGAKGAAARLGMSRTTLQAKMERLGIKRPE